MDQFKTEGLHNSPSTSLAFNRFRGPNAVFSIQRVTNKRGSFLEITKFLQQGSKQNIILPSGNNMWGWKRLAKYLSNFLQRKKQMSMQMGIHRGKVNHANQIRNQVQRIQMMGKEEATDKSIHCEDKNWNEALNY